MTNEITGYRVINLQTKERVGGWYMTRQRARRAADKLDLQYGAIRYGVVEVTAELIGRKTDQTVDHYAKHWLNELKKSR